RVRMTTPSRTLVTRPHRRTTASFYSSWAMAIGDCSRRLSPPCRRWTRGASATASVAEKPSPRSGWRRSPSPATASSASAPSRRKSGRPRANRSTGRLVVSLRSWLLVVLLLGAASLISLHTTAVRTALGVVRTYDLPLMALLAAAFCFGATLAFGLGIFRD